MKIKPVLQATFMVVGSIIGLNILAIFFYIAPLLTLVVVVTSLVTLTIWCLSKYLAKKQEEENV